MTDFFDRFECQLIDAGKRLCPAPAAAPAATRRAWFARRPVLAIAFVLVLASAALAATQPWEPDSITHSKFPPPSISSQAPPASELQMLAVLRRDVTPADRSAAVDRIVGFAGSPRSTGGVRTDYVRRVGTHATGAPIVLVPLRDWTPGGSISKPDALCVLYPDSTADGAGKGCWTEAEVGAGKALASLGRNVFGLVPDGVATVSLQFEPGGMITAPVVNNFFDVPVPTELGARTPAALSPKAIGWLDASGNPVGP